MNRNKTEKQLEWQGRHLDVYCCDAWEFVSRKGITGIVGIVAVTDDGKLVLVEQYRPPVDARVIDSLPHIAVPVLVIIGDGDSDFLQGSNYMASRIPGAINVVVPGGGHGINVDQPEAVNNALGEFLAGL